MQDFTQTSSVIYKISKYKLEFVIFITKKTHQILRLMKFEVNLIILIEQITEKNRKKSCFSLRCQNLLLVFVVLEGKLNINGYIRYLHL